MSNIYIHTCVMPKLRNTYMPTEKENFDIHTYKEQSKKPKDRAPRGEYRVGNKRHIAGTGVIHVEMILYVVEKNFHC